MLKKLTALMVLSLSFSCTAAQRAAVVTDVKQCAAAAFAAGTADLEGAVTGILVAGAPNWQAQLVALEVVDGVDGVVCAVVKTLTDLEKLVPPGATTSAQASAAVTAAAGRAQTYLQSKKVKL